MYKKVIKSILFVITMSMVILNAGCKNNQTGEVQNKQTETTIGLETSVATEATMSAELEEALREGWIVDDWEDETQEETRPETNDSTASKPTPPKPTTPQPTTPKPTTPQPTTPQPTEPKPTETQPAETQPEQTKPAVTITEYEKYLAMSPTEQQAFFENFESVDAYFAWLNKAKVEYEAKQNATELEGGSVDLGDLIG